MFGQAASDRASYEQMGSNCIKWALSCYAANFGLLPAIYLVPRIRNDRRAYRVKRAKRVHGPRSTGPTSIDVTGAPEAFNNFSAFH